MIAVFKTFIFQICCIFLFSLLYWMNSDEFERNFPENKKYKKKYLDHLLDAVTVQASVGYTSLHPITPRAKMLVILQHFLMLSANILILYFFSLHLLNRKK